MGLEPTITRQSVYKVHMAGKQPDQLDQNNDINKNME